MGAGPAKKLKDPNEVSSTFTVDADVTGVQDVPGITRLLNRKTLRITKGSESPTSPAAPPPFRAPPAFASPPPQVQPQIQMAPLEALSLSFEENTSPTPESIPLVTTSQSVNSMAMEPPAEISIPSLREEPSQSSTATPQVRPAILRAERRTGERLTLWTKESLENNPDPLAQALKDVVAGGVREFIFLATRVQDKGGKTPIFHAIAAFAPRERLRLWTGLRWNPQVVPELWALFVKAGVVELSPPGTITSVTSARNVVRAAFGVTSKDYLTLIRVGPLTACRGVVALISEKSIEKRLKTPLEAIGQIRAKGSTS